MESLVLESSSAATGRRISGQTTSRVHPFITRSMALRWELPYLLVDVPDVGGSDQGRPGLLLGLGWSECGGVSGELGS